MNCLDQEHGYARSALLTVLALILSIWVASAIADALHGVGGRLLPMLGGRG